MEIPVINSDFQIVRVHPHLLSYVDALQNKNSEHISFYPRCVFERESERGRIFLGLLNGEPCGYLFVGAGGMDVKCHQVCIEYDARRRLYGAALVAAMEDYAEACGAYTLTLRCGFDLDANDFWSNLGYRCVAVVPGGARRMRKINVWRRQITPELFSTECVEPSRGKVDGAAWRRHNQTGIVTKFARGNELSDYRAMIESGN